MLVLVVFLQSKWNSVWFGKPAEHILYLAPFKLQRHYPYPDLSKDTSVHSLKFMLRNKAWSCDVTEECLSAFMSHPCESKNLVKSLWVGAHVTCAPGNSGKFWFLLNHGFQHTDGTSNLLVITWVYVSGLQFLKFRGFPHLLEEESKPSCFFSILADLFLNFE